MARLALHHVNVIVTDLPRSLAFYEKLFGLTIIERPPFKNAGAWLGCGALQVHLSVHPPGSFRTGNVDGADTHFAFRTDDFDSALATLTANGFREDAAEDDPMHVMVRRNGPAGFPQLFLLDPTATYRDQRSALAISLMYSQQVLPGAKVTPKSPQETA